MPTSDRAAVSLSGCHALVTDGVGFIGPTSLTNFSGPTRLTFVLLDNFVSGNRDNLTWALANGPLLTDEGVTAR